MGLTVGLAFVVKEKKSMPLLGIKHLPSSL
jgi:hypothetical protein